MKKEMSKIFVFVVLGLIIASFLVGVVAAQTSRPIDIIRNLFQGFNTEDFRLYSAQFLFLMLVTLIIYAISNFIPFLEQSHPGLRFMVALIIGILSTLYLAPEEIYTALLGYEALGIALTTVIPLIVLLTFTIQWDTRYPEHVWFTVVIWVAFLAAYLIKYYQQLLLWLTGQETQIGGFGLLFVAITFITSIIMITAGGYVSRLIFRRRLKGLIHKGAIRSDAERTGLISRLEQLKVASPELAAEFDEQINKLRRLQFRT